MAGCGLLQSLYVRISLEEGAEVTLELANENHLGSCVWVRMLAGIVIAHFIALV